MREYRLTYAELNAMTLPQTWVLMFEGKPPQPGRRRFSSLAELQEFEEARRGAR